MNIFVQQERPSTDQAEEVNPGSDACSQGKESNVELIEIATSIAEILLEPA